MKSNRTCAVLLATLLGATGAAFAAETDTTAAAAATTAPGAVHMHHFGHARGGLLLGSLLRATRQLNLTDVQKSSIKSLLVSAHQAQGASGESRPDITVLGNPGHPDYASAVQNAKTLASARVDRESALARQIYEVLTPEQQAQLPNVLAGMKTRAERGS